ncbi:hypothetical protein HMPREF0462_1608 [Helicobacter pylori 83]|uniref:Uncharacterized protein n=1 Tax=Helicobacter pylori 83 TaxID=585538 RepID=F4D4R2_HELPX|nr:hypothetical protein HMPREF0462_1608 [Helicobacter pylori 83]
MILQDTEKSRINSTNKVFTALKNANTFISNAKSVWDFLLEWV